MRTDSVSHDGVAVLAVGADERARASLHRIFSHTRWRLFDVPNCKEALDFLVHNTVGVIICDSILADGSWKDLLVLESSTSPVLIVAAREPDSACWKEALSLGAYDVLSKPFQSKEVTRIVSLAWLHWKERTRPAPMAAGKVGLYNNMSSATA